jgi:hypothetical protein
MIRQSLAGVAVAAAILASAACSTAPPQSFGYRPGVVPGVTRDKIEAILGKPTSTGPFKVGDINADVMIYPFGQIILENDRTVVITIIKDPAYKGPFGAAPGVMNDQFQASVKAQKVRRSGHTEYYDVLVTQGETRTRDWYDPTDNLMVESAATNANDPEAPYQIVAVNLANEAGRALLEQLVKSKLSGDYPDQHVQNYTSEPWST